MKEWFENLEQRDQRALLAGLFIGLPLMIYLLIWDPFITSINTKQQDIVDQENRLLNARHLAKQIAELGGKPLKTQKKRKNQSLLSIVDSSLKRNQMSKYLKQITPIKKDRVKLKLENVSFDAWSRWLQKINQDYAIDIETLRIDKQNEAGRVDVRLMLKG